MLGLLVAGSAIADPRTIDVPATDHEAATQPLGRRPQTPATGAKAFGGGWAAGMVIEPKHERDAEPYPRGMVIEPPDVGDSIGIPPGGLGLPGPRTWAARLVRGLDRGVGSVLDVIIPSHL